MEWQELIIVGLFILIVASSADFLRMFFILIQSNIVKFVVVFFGYFIYYLAELISKKYIYEITNAYPDTFSTAIYFFNFGFIFLSWTGLIILLSLILLILLILASFFKNLAILNKIINKVLSFLVHKLQFESVKHLELSFCLGLFISGAIIFGIVCYLLKFEIKYREHIVFLSSYEKNQTPNGDKICSLIEGDKYIHLLGDNRVSIAPYYYLKTSLIPFFTIEKNSLEDFKTQKCNEN